jgi:hypothetical protein
MNTMLLSLFAGTALLFVTACARNEPAPAGAAAAPTKTVQIPGLPSTAPSTTTQVPKTF